MNFKKIHIGSLIEKRVMELEIESSRICNFLKCDEKSLANIYLEENISTQSLLRLSKLLEYDFFRVYSQHLILYSPTRYAGESSSKPNGTSSLPRFRKNIYTKEVIDFILELIEKGQKTRQQIIDDYRIPKTTLYKWMDKYQKGNG